MSQVSKNNLESIIQKELFELFYYSISDLQNPRDVEVFFSEFLTKTERIMLSKRFFIAVLLTKGYSYRDIRGVLKVSFPTIRSVQFWLAQNGEGYKTVIEKLIRQGKIASFLAKIDRLIDKTSSEKNYRLFKDKNILEKPII